MNDRSFEYTSDVDQPRGFRAGVLAGLLAGVLLGGVAGAGAMWLLAPQSGTRTRADIQHRSRELRDQTTETVEDVVSQARVKAHQITEGVQEQAEKLQQRGQDVLDEQKERVSEAVETTKKTARRSRG